MDPFAPLIRTLMARRDLTREESASLLGSLLASDAEGFRLLAYSVAQETKGETAEEMLGILDAMLAATGPWTLGALGPLMDLSSSGGSGIPKLNVSTLAALVVGEPDLPVAKTSFFGISSVTGSADVLAALGLQVPAVTLEQLGWALSTVGVAFYSPLFISPELCNLVNFGRVLVGKTKGVNTPFHVVGPLFTPLSLTFRVYGVYRPEPLPTIVEVCRRLGHRCAISLRGDEGLDEASLCAPTRVLGFRDGEEVDFVLAPEAVGLATCRPEEVRPRDARSNARDFLRIAHGVERGPKRDLVALNSGLALWLAGRAGTVEEGVRLALGRLERGEPAAKLAALVERCGSPDALRQAAEEHLGT